MIRGHRAAARILAALAIAATAVVAGAGTASADGGQGAVEVTPEAAAPNSTYTAVAEGFAAGSPVEVRVPRVDTPAPVTANGGGTASVTFTSDGKPGTFQVTFLGRDPSGELHVAQGAFSNLDTTCALSPCKNVSTLPRTGGRDVEPILIGALVLLGAGAVAAGRSRVLRTAGAAAVLLAVVVPQVADAPPAAAQATGTGTISGVVTQAGTGAGLPGVCVQAVSATTYREAVTGAGGAYQLAAVPAGVAYRVGFVDCTDEPAHRAFTNGTAFPTADQTVTSSATLTPVAVLGGVTTVASGGAPAPSCVGVGPSVDQLAPCAAASGASGAYLTEVAPGSIDVLFQPNDPLLAGEYFSDAHAPADASPVTAEAGTIAVADAAFEGGAAMSGTVTDAASGGPPARRTCAAVFTNGATGFASSPASADDGSFTIDHLAAGDHKVRFFDCDDNEGTPYVEQFFAAKPSLETADEVALAAGETAEGVDASMSTSGVPTTSSTSSSSTTSTTAGGGSSTSSSTSTTASTVPGGSSTSTTSTTAPGGGSPTSSSTTPGSSSSTSAPPTATTLSPTPLPADGPLSTGVTTPAPGQSFVVTGDGFAPGSTGTAVLYSAPVVLGRGTADAAGRITLTVTVPLGTSAGLHTLQLQGVDPSGRPRVLSTSLRVTAPAGGLPRTGSDAQDLLLVALALLGAGMLAEGTRLRRSVV